MFDIRLPISNISNDNTYDDTEGQPIVGENTASSSENEADSHEILDENTKVNEADTYKTEESQSLLTKLVTEEPTELSTDANFNNSNFLLELKKTVEKTDETNNSIMSDIVNLYDNLVEEDISVQDIYCSSELDTLQEKFSQEIEKIN